MWHSPEGAPVVAVVASRAGRGPGREDALPRRLVLGSPAVPRGDWGRGARAQPLRSASLEPRLEPGRGGLRPASLQSTRSGGERRGRALSSGASTAMEVPPGLFHFGPGAPGSCLDHCPRRHCRSPGAAGERNAGAPGPLALQTPPHLTLGGWHLAHWAAVFASVTERLLRSTRGCPRCGVWRGGQACRWLFPTRWGRKKDPESHPSGSLFL